MKYILFFLALALSAQTAQVVQLSDADALKAHVEKCPKHPMSRLKAENKVLREQLVVKFSGRLQEELVFAIRGGMMDAVHAHGPITDQFITSAVKRIAGAVKGVLKRNGVGV